MAGTALQGFGRTGTEHRCASSSQQMVLRSRCVRVKWSCWLRPCRALSAGQAQGVLRAHWQRTGPVGPTSLSGNGHLMGSARLPSSGTEIQCSNQLSYPRLSRGGDRTHAFGIGALPTELHRPKTKAGFEPATSNVEEQNDRAAAYCKLDATVPWGLFKPASGPTHSTFPRACSFEQDVLC